MTRTHRGKGGSVTRRARACAGERKKNAKRYAPAQAGTCAYIHLCVFVCIYTNTLTYIYIHLYTNTLTHTYIYVYTNTLTHIYTCVCACVCIYIYKHTHTTCTHTHTHTHTHTQTRCIIVMYFKKYHLYRKLLFMQEIIIIITGEGADSVGARLFF